MFLKTSWFWVRPSSLVFRCSCLTTPLYTWGNRTNVCDFHICAVCFCFCVLHWRIALPLYWGPIHQAGPPLPRACNFPHSVSGRGRGGGRAVGALVPFVLVLGFLLFHLHVLACALLLALVLVFFSLCVFVHLCGAFVQLEVPARLVTNPAPDRQNRQLWGGFRLISCRPIYQQLYIFQTEIDSFPKIVTWPIGR